MTKIQPQIDWKWPTSSRKTQPSKKKKSTNSKMKITQSNLIFEQTKTIRSRDWSTTIKTERKSVIIRLWRLSLCICHRDRLERNLNWNRHPPMQQSNNFHRFIHRFRCHGSDITGGNMGESVVGRWSTASSNENQPLHTTSTPKRISQESFNHPSIKFHRIKRFSINAGSLDFQ